MAFSFGSSNQPAFGSNVSKPMGFGTPFGASTTTTAVGQIAGTATFGSVGAGTGGFGGQSTTFGAGSTFGTAQTGGSTFGSTTFGAAQPQQQAQQAQTQPTFGLGSTAGTSAPAFGAQPFGQSSTGGTTGGLFGSTAQSKPTLFGTAPAQQQQQTQGAPANTLFSTQPAVGSTAPSLFGTTPATSQAAAAAPSGLFGASTGTQQQQAPTLFGAQTSTAPGSNLFGGTAGGQTSQAPSLFGGGTTTFGTGAGTSGALGTGTTNLFGGAAQSTQPSFGIGSGSLFGTGTGTSGQSLFGTGGATGTTTGGGGGFGGFGTGGFGGGGFGTTSTVLGARPTTAGPAQPAATTQQQVQLVINSIYNINIFNDERDDILKKWNLLQACWGTGKGYFNPSQPPVEYTVHNPYYRFKAIGYNVIPEHDNAEGLVKLVFNKKYSELSTQKQVLVNGLTGILGNRPNLKVTVQHVKALSETQTEVKICVDEKGVTGSARRILATDLAAFLNQPVHKQQLANVGVTAIVAFVTPSKAALEEYLKTVPPGFDPQMWKAAIADNPNPLKYMPVPIYGFGDLKSRKMKQEHETGLHRAFEEKINKELTELKKKHAASVARINEFKHRFLQLQHRTLRILVRQESIRKAGIAIQPEEEFLKGKLETMYSHLNVPTQFKGQLNELISTVKLMERTATKPFQTQYKLVPESQSELKDYLQLQQNGIAKLVEIVKEDMRSLNIIQEGMKQILQNKQNSSSLF